MGENRRTGEPMQAKEGSTGVTGRWTWVSWHVRQTCNSDTDSGTGTQAARTQRHAEARRGTHTQEARTQRHAHARRRHTLESSTQP